MELNIEYNILKQSLPDTRSPLARTTLTLNCPSAGKYCIDIRS